ncbi:suppressor of fused domain protein [Streptomyces sp. YIM 98790]|uniref:suppressor of fused domain protein n=1 Tax=Streptomyces sp. YIM 98790 TaxID=2689077 RepID=UPI0014087E86|nr:suppressor of fused domain protein [Streptomyces sp. YIM 98790]
MENSDSGDERATVLTAVEAALTAALGPADARASVTFLGTERIEVLRFLGGSGAEGPGTGGPALRYATLGMSAEPMADPTAVLAEQVRGPRAELLLSLRPGSRPPLPPLDRVLRPLAALAAAPRVEGLVITPGASLDLGEPLWPGAPFTSVLVGEPGGLVPDLELPAPREPVRFLPLLPMTPDEAAWKRAHGAAALQERWLRHGTDLRDPQRRGVRLDE